MSELHAMSCSLWVYFNNKFTDNDQNHNTVSIRPLIQERKTPAGLERIQ